ncbi:hypothetical protein F8S13_16285 [Chloroflexia bacterium SDU3-3]|nr:hypothetical protein F8S13_16285 [Chloroflexia bacterium SDU3-3]
MTDLTSDLAQLLREGQAAITAGDMMTARDRFRRATELAPGSAEAWVGLSAAVPMLMEKKQYLEQALAIAPEHVDARSSLEYVQKLMADGMQLAPSRRREEQVASGNSSPLLSSASAAPQGEAALHCYRHPDRETGLLCTNCGRPICSACARPAAVGQLCPECIKERRPVNYKVSAKDIILGFVVALIASAIVSALLSIIPIGGWIGWILLLMVGPGIAELIVRIVDWVTHAKRGRAMQITVGAAIVLATLPVIALGVIFDAAPITLLLYMILAVVTTSARLR